MKYVIRDLFSKGMKRQGEFLSFLPRFAVNTNGLGMSQERNFERINEKTKRENPWRRRRKNDLTILWPFIRSCGP